MATISITSSYSFAGTTHSTTREKTASSVTIVEETVATAQTDSLIAFTLDVSACKAFRIVSSAAITVETNSGSAADNTLTLAANEPYEWNVDSEHTFLLTADVTGLYITNASGATATIQIFAAVDATP